MRPPRLRVAAALGVIAWVAVSGCSFDGPKPGIQDVCSTASGRPLGCESVPIDTAEDACAKLAACGAIPIEDPNPDAPDFPDCVDNINSLDDFRFEFALACVEVSTCDELVSTPSCFEHGDED
jgi:hypothetical protein